MAPILNLTKLPVPHSYARNISQQILYAPLLYFLGRWGKEFIYYIIIYLCTCGDKKDGIYFLWFLRVVLNSYPSVANTRVYQAKGKIFCYIYIINISSKNFNQVAVLKSHIIPII